MNNLKTKARRDLALRKLKKLISGVAAAFDYMENCIGNDDLSWEMLNFIREEDINNLHALFWALQSNKFFVLCTVSANGNKLRNASMRFKDDEDVVITAIKDRAESILYASERIKKNKKILLMAIKKNPKLFKLLTVSQEKLRNDKDFVLSVIKIDAMLLEFASEKLRDDKHIIFSAIKRDSSSIRYASSRLRKDSTVISLYIKFTDLRILQLAPEEIMMANLNLLTKKERVSLYHWYCFTSGSENIFSYTTLIKEYLYKNLNITSEYEQKNYDEVVDFIL